MHFFLQGLLVGLLAGCAAAPRDISLEGLDLADGKTLAALQSALPLDDRGALGTYALLHWPKSKFYCGAPIAGKVAAATTVGEAIELTRAYEVKLVRQQARNAERVTAQSNRAQSVPARREIVDRIERVVLERDMLFQRMGPAASTSREGKAINQRLVILKRELARTGRQANPQASNSGAPEPIV